MSDERVTPDGDVAIVGAGLSGIRTAEALRRQGFTGRIDLVGAEDQLPYDRPPLSKTALAKSSEAQHPQYLVTPERLEHLGLDLRVGVTATALDYSAKTLSLNTGDRLLYSRLVIATGARPAVPDVAGLQHAYTLRTWGDLQNLRAALAGARHATIVGAGVLGCELASTLRSRQIGVTVIEASPHPMLAAFGGPVGEMIGELHRARGVDLRCSTRLAAVHARPRGWMVVTDRGEIPTDVVIVATGAHSNTEWLQGSGLELDRGVLCDRTGMTSAEDVYAVGDVARYPHPYVNDQTVRFERWMSAADTASVVARNILRTRDERLPLTAVPYFWSEQYGSRLQCIGLPAYDHDIDVVTGSLEAGRFLACYTYGGVLTGALTIGMQTELNEYRAFLGEPRTLETVGR